MGEFRVYPAIDLSDGKVVRLRQGAFHEKTVYPLSAEQYARSWLECGARWLHVVNLDGALETERVDNRTCLAKVLRVAEEFGASIQYGGGVRSLADIENVIRMGIRRVMIGTLAVENAEALREAVARFSAERVIAAVDVRGGKVQSHGWKHDSEQRAVDYAQHLKARGVCYILCTDVQRDGMGGGLNLDLAKELIQIGGLKVILAGGVISNEDVYSAKEIGAAGVVVGRALYEGKVDLQQLLAMEECPLCQPGE